MAYEDIKEKIKIAKDAVKDEEEPYKTEAFKMILSNLLESNTKVRKSKGKSGKRKLIRDNKKTQGKLQLEQKNDLEELASKCNLTKEQLTETISIKNDIIQIVKRPKLIEKIKHLKFSLCILTCYKILYDLEWCPTKLLRKCLDSSGSGDLMHIYRDIIKSPEILDRGEKKGKEYKITGKGMDEGCKIIQKLCKNESITDKSPKN